ncbi:hypothetical protein BB559_000530 [Furculomyces boomerangus]|uniref:Arginine biosynthesis bifunctional protein ArgJ, mitochondrial n=1 Tax=Furculomyces boomerangus TaxID=61424 RepID=A0A2T9Z4T9_9FUNG|nr:hypothetical protein BB559_000530 [Furculomyces boomerangus]
MNLLVRQKFTALKHSRILPLSFFSMKYSDLSAFPETKRKYIPTSGIYPKGFLVGSLHCGIKKNKNKDLTLILSTKPCTASAVFTKNQVVAAPVEIDRKLLNEIRELNKDHIRSIIVNSGVANSVTGELGYKNGKLMAEAADKYIDQFDSKTNRHIENNPEKLLSKSLIMSTGVIGQQLPIEKITTGVKQLEGKLGDSHAHWMEAAAGFMTTDTFPKIMSKEFELPSRKGKYRFCGIAKGAGMIHPNMATLLATVTTDASITQSLLDKALSYAADKSFNSITVDGDTSTNDTVAILANGLASTENSPWKISTEDQDFESFKTNLSDFMKDLAILVVRDGEGATKFIKINVQGAETVQQAHTVGMSIATSPLVKTAFYGMDANWGRILCAAGYSSAKINPQKIGLSLIPSDNSPPMELVKNGQPLPLDEDRALSILKLEDIGVEVTLGMGNESATVFTCDFSHEYITINGSYRS